jgi:hypothetical protein
LSKGPRCSAAAERRARAGAHHLVRPGRARPVTPARPQYRVRSALTSAEPFDLGSRRTSCCYYDVFEQSLAGINIAKMLRPGGFS